MTLVREAIATSELERYNPIFSPYASNFDLSKLQKGLPWPDDIVRVYFRSSTKPRRYLLFCNTFNGRGGEWRPLKWWQGS